MNVRPRSRCIAKIYRKTVLNEEIPVNKDQEKDQSYVKVGRIDVHDIKMLKLWVRLKYLPFQWYK